MTDDVRKGQAPGHLPRTEFGVRFRNSFVDPAFDAEDDAHRPPRGDRLGGLQRRPQGAAARARPGPATPTPTTTSRSTGSRPSERLEQRRSGAGPIRRRRSRVLVICGSPRNDGTCPGEISKTFRLARLVREDARAGAASRSTCSTSACSPPSTAATSIRARAACRPRCRSATGRAAAIRTMRSNQTNDWMAEIYERWIAAHGVVIVTPVALVPDAERAEADDRPAGLRRRRQPRSDLDRTARSPTKAKAIELDGLGLSEAPRRPRLRRWSCTATSPASKARGARSRDWLDWMGLIDAGDQAPARPLSSATTSRTRPATTTLDRDTAVQEEVRNVARAVDTHRRPRCAAGSSARSCTICRRRGLK